VQPKNFSILQPAAKSKRKISAWSSLGNA